MVDEEVELTNLCADLLSLKKFEPFPKHLLLEKQAGEWACVRDLCQSLGLDLGAVKSDLFVTWLADPTSAEEYAVVMFYDDESKWSQAAQYNRAFTKAVPLQWEQMLARIVDSRQDPLYMPTATLAAISYVEDCLDRGDPAGTPIPFVEIEKRFDSDMDQYAPEKKGKAFQPVYWLSPNVEAWDIYRGSNGPLVPYDPHFRPWQAWMIDNDIHVRFKPALLKALLDVRCRDAIRMKLEALRDTGTTIGARE